MMSIRIYAFLSLSAILLQTMVSFAQNRPARSRHALLVSLGRYASVTGWSETSAGNDTRLMMSALSYQGFDTLRNVVKVADAQATRAGIVAALEDMTKRVKPGDIVVIHLSAHGVQVRDANSEETDGLDEGIAPYDALSPQAPASAGEKIKGYLLDDDFEKLVLQIRKRLDQSGELLVLLDIGYASSRGGAAARHRGLGIPVISDEKPNGPVATEAETHLFREASSYLGPESGHAFCVYLSSSDATTTAFEVRPSRDAAFGMLTQSFVAALPDVDPAESLSSFFGRMQTQAALLSPGSRLVMEAEQPERPLFNGFLLAGPSIGLKRLDKDGAWIVSSGSGAGLADSARVAFFKAGVRKPFLEKLPRLAEGQVASVSGFEARLRGLRLPSGQTLSGLAGMVVEKPWIHHTFSVDFVMSKTGPGAENIRGLFRDEELQALRDRFNGASMVRLGGDADLLVRKAVGGDEVVLASNGQVIGRMEEGPDLSEQLLGIVRRLSHGRMMMQEQASPDLRAQVALVPVLDGQPQPVGGKSRLKAGFWEFAEGETAAVVVSNPNSFPIYGYMFEVALDGSVRCVLPDAGRRLRAEDAMILSGQEMVFTDPRMLWHAGTGTGHRIIKCFFTREPMDLQLLADPEAMGQELRPHGVGFGRLAGLGFEAGNRSIRVAHGAGLATNLHLWIGPAAPMKGR